MAVSNLVAAGGGVTQKVQEFTSTGTFTVPSNCSSVDVFLVAGGGGGGGRTYQVNAGGMGGGGGGGGVIQRTITVTPGASYTVTIGAGGSGGQDTGQTNGSNSTFGALLTAIGGGYGGGANSNLTGANGGCGGGSGISCPSSTIAGSGGTGGGAGAPSHFNPITYYSGTYPVSAFSQAPGITYGPGKGSQGSNGGHAIWGGGGSNVQGMTPDLISPATRGINGFGGGGRGGCPSTIYGVDGGGNGGFGAVTAGGTNTGGGGGGGYGGYNGSGSGAAGGSGYCRVVYWS